MKMSLKVREDKSVLMKPGNRFECKNYDDAWCGDEAQGGRDCPKHFKNKNRPQKWMSCCENCYQIIGGGDLPPVVCEGICGVAREQCIEAARRDWGSATRCTRKDLHWDNNFVTSRLKP